MHKIVAIVGMCGSGKSVVTSVFTDEGFERVYFGGVTMDILAEKGLPKTEQNEREIREGLRKEHGQGAFAKLLLPKINALSETGDVVLDGLYSWEEYKILKERFGERFFMLAVIADRAVRYDRLAERLVRPLTHEQAKSRDYAEIENLQKGGPIAIADWFAMNNGGVGELKQEILRIIKEIRGE